MSLVFVDLVKNLKNVAEHYNVEHYNNEIIMKVANKRAIVKNIYFLFLM